MSYNPTIHNRRSIRLKGYDYSKSGAYFITICCANREARFGRVEKGEMILNEYGAIAYDEWIKLQERFSNFGLDVFQIMPNHMHGIIVLTENRAADPAGAGFTPAQLGGGKGNGNRHERATARVDSTVAPTVTPTERPAIGRIDGAYKSIVTNK